MFLWSEICQFRFQVSIGFEQFFRPLGHACTVYLSIRRNNEPCATCGVGQNSQALLVACSSPWMRLVAPKRIQNPSVTMPIGHPVDVLADKCGIPCPLLLISVPSSRVDDLVPFEKVSTSG